MDVASANDLGHRIAWKALTDDAIEHKFDAVLVFKLDRAFRSVKHMHDTLAVWDLSSQHPIDLVTQRSVHKPHLLGNLRVGAVSEGPHFVRFVCV